MPFLVIPYPVVDPVLIQIGAFPIRWYALAYIGGLLAGWFYARGLVRDDAFWGATPRAPVQSLDDLLVYIALGVVIGGRLGYVLFYNFGYYLSNPGEVFSVWKGGMAFHGGVIGAVLAIWLFARRTKIPALTIADVVAATAPIGLFLGRIANFIKPELWGRASEAPWAMVFPDAGPVARHPSQLYEAGLEGVVLFAILRIVVRAGGLRRPGLVTGVFGVGYGAARIVCEFFREPDAQLGYLFGGATMGMLLSIPLVLTGLALIALAQCRREVLA